jgi:hypothetical protein
MTSGALTTDQREEFRTTGLLRLDGAFPRAAAEAMGDRVWEFLGSRYGILRGERSTWTVEKPAGYGGEAFRMPRVRAALAAHPWLRGLWEPGHGGDRIQRYMHDGTVVDGVPLLVVELAGEPGDVVVMHSDCFHTAAPNRLAEPRMMLTGMIESSL